MEGAPQGALFLHIAADAVAVHAGVLVAIVALHGQVIAEPWIGRREGREARTGSHAEGQEHTHRLQFAHFCLAHFLWVN